MKRAFLLFTALALFSAFASAQGTSGTRTEVIPSGCTTTDYDTGLIDVPTGYPTALKSASTCVVSITFMNTTASPIFVWIRDGRGRSYGMTYAMPFAPLILSFNNIRFLGGIQWTASSSGLNGQVKGFLADTRFGS